MNSNQVSKSAERICEQLNLVIMGKAEVMSEVAVALLSHGHLLIEDVPGVGKTTLAKAIAKLVGGEFKRIQFTPDLLPSDITGTSVFNQATRLFEFMPGPIFANVVLADEINRSTPKTQSALLEAMEEAQVTTDGVERQLNEPFFVLATQNNVEMMGTFPLPEAQLDRFFGRLTLGYPDRDAEINMIEQQQVSHPLDRLEAVLSTEELIEMQRYVRTIHVETGVREYIVDIVRATREHASASLGASPRASLNLMLGGQAHAAMHGRDFVTPDDVKAIAKLVLAHRVVTRGEARSNTDASTQLIESILTRVPVPVGA